MKWRLNQLFTNTDSEERRRRKSAILFRFHPVCKKTGPYNNAKKPFIKALLTRSREVRNVRHYRMVPIPVAESSKLWVCGRSLAGIAGSNPDGGMDVCLMRSMCVVTYRPLRRADLSSRGVLHSVCVLCVCVIVIMCNNNPLYLQWVGRKRSEYDRKKKWKRDGCMANTVRQRLALLHSQIQSSEM